MELLILQVIIPLVIALIGIWVKAKWDAKKELHSCIYGIVFELTENLRIARTIKHSVDQALEVIRKGGWSPAPDPTFLGNAYLRATFSDVFFNSAFKKESTFIRKLHDCYASLQVVNQYTEILNREKFEVLTKPSMLPQRIEEILLKQKEVIEKAVEPSIVELLAIFSIMEKKSKDVVSLLASVPEL
jgi:hypothetical protein